MRIQKHRTRKSMEDYVIDTIVYAFLILLMLIIILPVMQVVTISVSPSHVVNRYGQHIIPTEFDFSGYAEILQDSSFIRSYGNTIARAVIGTFLSVLVTLITAYPLAKTNLPYRRGIMMFIVFTMYFSGGTIPTYLLIKSLGLRNNFLVYILPGLVMGFALIITRNFFMSLPKELEESAKIDGAGNLRVLFQIYMPLSMPVVATIALWYCVRHWNSWYDNMLYVNDRNLYVVQYLLRTILSSGQTAEMEMTVDTIIVHTETLKMAALVLTLIPIVCVYPFLQKYFVQGMMVGSVKG